MVNVAKARPELDLEELDPQASRSHAPGTNSNRSCPLPDPRRGGHLVEGAIVTTEARHADRVAHRTGCHRGATRPTASRPPVQVDQSARRAAREAFGDIGDHHLACPGPSTRPSDRGNSLAWDPVGLGLSSVEPAGIHSRRTPAARFGPTDSNAPGS